MVFTKTTNAQTGSTCAGALSLTISVGQNTGWQTTPNDTLWYTFTALNDVHLFKFETSLANKKSIKNIVYGHCGNLFPADYLHTTSDSTFYLNFLNLITSEDYRIGLVFGLTGNCTSCSDIGNYKLSFISAVASYTGCAVASCSNTPTCEYLCNGNFEQFGGSSSGIPQEYSEIEKACGWKSANGASPDYYHTSAPTGVPFSVNIPSNFAGCEAVRTPPGGNAYAGLFTGFDFYEALVSPLKSTLINGNKYVVSFYLSLGDAAVRNTTNGLAYAFANGYTPTNAFNTFGATMTPTVINTIGVGRSGWAGFTRTTRA